MTIKWLLTEFILKLAVLNLLIETALLEAPTYVKITVVSTSAIMQQRHEYHAAVCMFDPVCYV